MRVRKPFRITKMQAGAFGSVSRYENAGRSSRLAKVLVLPKENARAFRRHLETHTPTPWRQHKNVAFRISGVKLDEKSYVRTRPEKSSGEKVFDLLLNML